MCRGSTCACVQIWHVWVCVCAEMARVRVHVCVCVRVRAEMACVGPCRDGKRVCACACRDSTCACVRAEMACVLVCACRNGTCVCAHHPPVDEEGADKPERGEDVAKHRCRNPQLGQRARPLVRQRQGQGEGCCC